MTWWMSRGTEGGRKGGREEDGEGERKEGRVGGRKNVCYKAYLLFIATLQLTDAELPHWGQLLS